MILIHRGRGYVVLIAGVVGALAMNVVTNALYDNDYYATHRGPKFGTLIVAGILCVLAGAYLQRFPTKIRDKDWIEGEAADHFFFVPVTYWGLVFFALGFIYLGFSLWRR